MTALTSPEFDIQAYYSPYTLHAYSPVFALQPRLCPVGPHFNYRPLRFETFVMTAPAAKAPVLNGPEDWHDWLDYIKDLSTSKRVWTLVDPSL